MSYWQTMRLVVLPQALRNMLPLLLTQTIVLFQDTSLVYVLSLTDFMGAASKVAQRDGRLVEMYLFAALVYFAVCFTRLVAGAPAADPRRHHPLRFLITMTSTPMPAPATGTPTANASEAPADEGLRAGPLVTPPPAPPRRPGR